MRPVDRIFEYIAHKGITPYEFEKKAGIANAYLRRQQSGSGVIGSELLVRILNVYPELSIIWVLTGVGNMIIEPSIESQAEIQKQILHNQLHNQPDNQLKKSVKSNEPKNGEESSKFVMKLLQDQIEVLNATIADKNRIITFLEQQLNSNK